MTVAASCHPLLWLWLRFYAGGGGSSRITERRWTYVCLWPELVVQHISQYCPLVVSGLTAGSSNSLIYLFTKTVILAILAEKLGCFFFFFFLTSTRKSSLFSHRHENHKCSITRLQPFCLGFTATAALLLGRCLIFRHFTFPWVTFEAVPLSAV